MQLNENLLVKVSFQLFQNILKVFLESLEYRTEYQKFKIQICNWLNIQTFIFYFLHHNKTSTKLQFPSSGFSLEVIHNLPNSKTFPLRYHSVNLYCIYIFCKSSVGLITFCCCLRWRMLFLYRPDVFLVFAVAVFPPVIHQETLLYGLQRLFVVFSSYRLQWNEIWKRTVGKYLRTRTRSLKFMWDLPLCDDCL